MKTESAVLAQAGGAGSAGGAGGAGGAPRGAPGGHYPAPYHPYAGHGHPGFHPGYGPGPGPAYEDYYDDYYDDYYEGVYDDYDYGYDGYGYEEYYPGQWGPPPGYYPYPPPAAWADAYRGRAPPPGMYGEGPAQYEGGHPGYPGPPPVVMHPRHHAPPRWPRGYLRYGPPQGYGGPAPGPHTAHGPRGPRGHGQHRGAKLEPQPEPGTGRAADAAKAGAAAARAHTRAPGKRARPSSLSPPKPRTPRATHTYPAHVQARLPDDTDRIQACLDAEQAGPISAGDMERVMHLLALNETLDTPNGEGGDGGAKSNLMDNATGRHSMGFKGITRTRYCKWQTQINVEGERSVYLGCFNNPLEAALVYTT